MSDKAADALKLETPKPEPKPELEPEAGGAFLGVEASLMGQNWQRRPFLRRHAEAIALQENIPLIAGEILASRGIEPEEAASYLAPSLRQDMPDPSVMVDMDRAVMRIEEALRLRQKIAVFGDYDVDGATSSALIVRYFSMIGVEVTTYIPDRMREGYGPNETALLGLRQTGVDLVLTVDCGSLSFGPLEKAAEAGLDVIVIDHHKTELVLPKAVALINPNRFDDESGLGYLAAVGVTFMLLVALNRSLKASGFLDNRGFEPDLLSLLDMVALGTVCDVVPLKGLNRAFVVQGLKVLKARQNLGLRTLCDVARIDETPTSYHLGFVLGPRINAGGRVGCSDLGVQLLTTQNEAEAIALSERLNRYNEERRQIEATVQEEAIGEIERRFGKKGPENLVFIAGAGWHPGVIGIVASRLKEKYGLPSLVMAIEEGEAKGSGRSISGVDLGAAVIDAVQEGHLLKGGGHAMAAGFTAREVDLGLLEAFIQQRLSAQIANARLSRSFLLDGVLAPSAATARLVDMIEQVGPFGAGNPGPRFAFSDMTLTFVDIVGDQHLRCRFKGRDGWTMKVMAFRLLDSALGQALLEGKGRVFHLAGRLRRDDWGGSQQAELTLEDAVLVS